MNSSTRILVVDNIPERLRTASRLLQSEGYEVFEVSTGQGALALARDRRPDLILLDAAPPDMNRDELCARMKALPGLQSSLIAIVSEQGSASGHCAEEIESDADSCLTRPIADHELLEHIRLLTSLKKMKDRLRESEETIQTFLSIPTDASVLLDAAGTILDCNETAALRFGQERAGLIGSCFWALYPTSVIERRKPLIDSVFLTGQPVRFEDERAGMWHDNVVQPVFDARGTVTKAVVLARDITSRRQSEKRIDHLNAVLRAIRNVNQSIVRETDRDRLLQGACDDLIETRGYFNAWIVLLEDEGADEDTRRTERVIVASVPETEISSRCVSDQINVGRLPGCIERALQQTGVLVLADPVSECDGCPLEKPHLERSVLIVRLEYAGRILGALGLSVPKAYAADAEELDLVDEIANDLAFALHNLASDARRREAEQKLHESEAKYRELFDRMSSGVVVYEVQDEGQTFMIRDINVAGQRIGSVNKEDVLGRSVMDAFPGVRQIGLHTVLQQVWRTGIPQHHPPALYQDGHIENWVENYVYKLPSGEVVAVYDDVSAQKELEQETESLARFPEKTRIRCCGYHRMARFYMQILPARQYCENGDATRANHCQMSGKISLRTSSAKPPLQPQRSNARGALWR